jgi:hypothetical protein
VELALAVYEEITGTTPLPTVAGEDSDRRKHRRMPFGFRATILPTRRGVEGPASVVMIRDMSLAGVSFLNEDALKNGIVFTIEFKGQRERPVKIRCTAVRCEQGGTGGTQYVIGATFDELLTKELPPLPKEEPLPPLSDQSHIRGRLIKPDSEIAHHTGAADGFSDNSGPAPAAPFSVTSQPEPDQPMIEQTRIYGRLIRPNSEFEKAAVRDNPMSQLSDQAPIAAKIAKPEPQPEIKAAPAPITVPDDFTTAKDPSASAVVDEEAEALAMLLAEPDSSDSSFDAFTLEDGDGADLSDDTSILEMLAEAGAEKTANAEPEPEPEPEPETTTSNQARILGRLTKSEPEPETKPALAAQPKTPEPAVKAAPKPEPETPPSDQARILGRLTKSEPEPEKKPALKLEPKLDPKPEPVTSAADKARSILSRLTKTEAQPEKKTAPAAVAPVAPPKAADPAPKPAPAPVSHPTAKAPAKVESENPPSDQDRLLSRLAKPEPETEKKPAAVSAAPAAPKVQPAPVVAKAEPIAKPAQKLEAAVPPSDQPKPAEKLTKTTPEPEIKRVPQVTASEDVVAVAKPAVAKAAPVAPAAPAAPPWSNASKTSAPAEQKPVVISRSQGKGVHAMSLAHTESTSEQPAPTKTDVVTGVKALLLQQRETLKKQEHELETLRAELTQAKRKCAQLQAKADADAKAMTELEAFLTKETNDLAQGDSESIAA